LSGSIETQANWLGYDTEFVADAREDDPLGVFSLQAWRPGFEIYATRGEEWWEKLGAWCKGVPAQSIYLWGWLALADAGPLITWEYPLTNKISIFNKRGQRILSGKPRGVQDRFSFGFAGKTFHLWDLKPLGSTMGHPSLESMGKFLTTYFKRDLTKLDACPHNNPAHMVTPKGEKEAKPFKCPTYAMRDAETTFMFAQYLLEQDLNPEIIGTPGALAAKWFQIPKYKTFVGRNVEMDEAEKDLRLEAVYAGRNECFRNGGPYPAHYVDTTSLYPLSMLLSRAPLITGVEQCSIDDIDMKPNLAGDNYGWLQSTHIYTDDKVWSLPIRDENVIYVTGDITNYLGKVYATDDLVAGRAQLLDEPSWVERPVFAQRGAPEEAIQNKMLDLYEKRLKGELPPEKAGLAKGAMNALSGLYGMSKPRAGSRTNYYIYAALLARSHLIMSEWCREVLKNGWEIYGFATDAGVISHPWTRSSSLGDIPYKFSVSKKNGHALSGQILYFRAKQYMFLCDDGAVAGAYHGWRYGHERYEELGEKLARRLGIRAPGETIPTKRGFEDEEISVLQPAEDSIEVFMETKRDLDTRAAVVKALRLGGWVKKTKTLDDKDLVRLFWADRKRNRPMYDSWSAVRSGMWYDSEPWDFISWKRFGREEAHRRKTTLTYEEIKNTNERLANTSHIRQTFLDRLAKRKMRPITNKRLRLRDFMA